MKQCPQCNRTYGDESITFCLADGVLLSAPYDPEATQRFPPPRSTSPARTEILPTQQSQPVEQKGKAKFIYAIVAVMAVVIVTLAAIIIVPRMSREEKTANTNSDLTNQTSNIGAQQTPVAKTKESPLPPAPPSSAVNSNASSSVLTELTGKWQGQWTSPEGYLYSAEGNFDATGSSNGIQGNINWILKKSPRKSEQSKLGQGGVEYVKGSYDPEKRILAIAGYRKEDPHQLVGVSKYKLTLTEDHRLEGDSWTLGRLSGRLSLSR